MKICFYVSRNATRLKKFLNYANNYNQSLLGLIGCVVTDNPNDVELHNMCNEIGIESVYLDNSSFIKKNIMSSDYIHSVMKDNGFDYLFIYCDTILKGKLIDDYKLKIINFHPSLLPAHEGLMAIDQALDNNTFLLGNSAHFVDKGIDTGPVIMQSIMPRIEFNCYNDVLDLQIMMIAQIILWLKESRVLYIDGKVSVSGASYTVSTYIPNIEI